MPLILMVIGVIAFGAFGLIPNTKLMQLEDQARQQLQSGTFAQLEAKYRPILQREKR